ncbi:MAG: TIGR03936 family radical SAM-associated protein [Planctomycetales bacterium]|nr:TIGR03936 family radical SAM-associated protein [Planctomycetales bacterium]
MISHRDLVRVWERLFRRAALQLSMSEGFHPKAKMIFPSALGLGIDGLSEIMEVEIEEQADVADLRRRLEPQCPPGLQILEISAPQPGAPKPQLVQTTYEVVVPADRQASAAEAISRLMSQDPWLLHREGRNEPIDVRADLGELSIDTARGVLSMKIRASRTASVRPREVLEAVGLGDLEQHGCHLTRTHVELNT